MHGVLREVVGSKPQRAGSWLLGNRGREQPHVSPWPVLDGARVFFGCQVSDWRVRRDHVNLLHAQGNKLCGVLRESSRAFGHAVSPA
jgi:hypothetical protein